MFPMDRIVSFLHQLMISGYLQAIFIRYSSKSGLDVLLDVWLENHSSFVGFYECKVSAVALAKLLHSHDPRIIGRTVRGDIIVTPGIMTRSRTRIGMY